MSDRQPEYTLPRWASTDDSRVVEPPTGSKNYGFQKGYKPPAQWVNWLWKHCYLWLSYLRLFMIGLFEHNGYARCNTLVTAGSPTQDWSLTVGASRVLVLSGVAYKDLAETNCNIVNVPVGDKITTSGITALYPHATYFVYLKDGGSTEEYEITRTAQTYGWQTGAEGTKRLVGLFRTNLVSGLSPFAVDVGFPLPCIMQGQWIAYKLDSATYTHLEVLAGHTGTIAVDVDFTAWIPALAHRTGIVRFQVEWTVTTGVGSFAVGGMARFFANATGQYSFDVEAFVDSSGNLSMQQVGLTSGAFTIRILGFGIRKG